MHPLCNLLAGCYNGKDTLAREAVLIKHRLSRVVCALYIGSASFWVFAGDFSGEDSFGREILAVSSTKKTVIIALGDFSGLRQGHRGEFIWQNSLEDPRPLLVAQGEAVKVFPDYSIWRIEQLYAPEYLTKGKYLYFVAYEDLLLGKRPFKLFQRKIVVAPGSTPEEYRVDRNRRNSVSPQYREGNYDFNRIEAYTEQLKWGDRDLEKIVQYRREKYRTKHLSQFEDPGDVYSVYNGLLIDDTSPLRKKYDTEVGESYIAATIHNFQKAIDHRDLYLDQEKDGLQIRKAITYNTNFEKMRDAKKYSYVNKDLLRTIRHHGPLWSANMSEDQLRKFFVASGILDEMEERERVLYKAVAHEFLFRYTVDMVDNTLAADLGTRGVGGYLGIGYEFHLGRTSRALNHLTINTHFLSGTNYYHLGHTNVHSSELVSKIGMNVYLLHPPDNMKKYLWYVGASIKAGRALLKSPDLRQQYYYEFFGFPLLHCGLKYRFDSGDAPDKVVRVGYGINLELSYEPMTMVARDKVNPDDRIVSEVEVTDTGFLLGFSLYF